MSPAESPAVTCYATGGHAPIRVCHGVADEGTFYQPAPHQVAYNVQVLKRDDFTYTTILHSESKRSLNQKVPTNGDSIKAGTKVISPAELSSAYTAPASLDYKIWGSLTDTNSYLYYGSGVPNENAIGQGGGGNPMVVQGRPGDNHFYMFFLSVSDFFKYNAYGWRDIVLEARTTDFVNFEILADDGKGGSHWAPFSDDLRPALVLDRAGKGVYSNFNPPDHKANGMIGSIVFHNGIYWYFYTDQDPKSEKWHLYTRYALSLYTNLTWSSPIVVADVPKAFLVRVAQAKGMNRWAVVYNCIRPISGPAKATVDVCLQYTENMNIVGDGGISSLSFFSSGKNPFALGLQGQNASLNDSAYWPVQPYYMTDSKGAMAAPSGEPQDYTRGGMLTWMSVPSPITIKGVFGATTYRAGWDVSAYPTKGVISSVQLTRDGSVVVKGWACAIGLAQTVSVQVYAMGSMGGRSQVAAGLADQASDPAIAQACKADGGNYRFSITLPASVRNQRRGDRIEMTAAGTDKLLLQSDAFVIP